MKKTLCKPCALGLATVKKIVVLPGKAKKDTCEICGHRRFCQKYEEGERE